MEYKVTQRIKVKVVSVVVAIFILMPCECQRDPNLLNLSGNSLRMIMRSSVSVPKGRSANFKDVILRFYGSNSTRPSSSYRLQAVKLLMEDPGFDHNRLTVVYAHGYVELASDDSVRSVVNAYLQNRGYNVLVLDWANLAFGNYLLVAGDIPTLGKETGIALLRLIKRGLPVSSLHLVGHSMGAHVIAYAARHLAARGHTIPRLTGLDPAYPGYYPPLLGEPISASDASFVDIIHTDGGGYGTPTRSGHADFWPNDGVAKQPGCPTATVPLTAEDFCSHWRSWSFWSESVVGGQFVARGCRDYDTFLRRGCHTAPLVYMGLGASTDLRGNFYLRTATKEPYALGGTGAE